MAHLFFATNILKILDGTIDVDGGTVKAALLKEEADGSWVPNESTNEFVSTAIGDEISGVSGYSTGGIALSGVAWSRTGTSIKLTSNDPDFGILGTGTPPASEIGRIIIYLVQGTESDQSTNLLLSVHDLAPTPTANVNVTVQTPTNGWILFEKKV